VELRGSLKNFPLPDIIQLIGMGRRTGVLAVVTGSDQASIWFDSGDMIHAEYGALEGAKVIYQLFRKQDGSFQFTSGAPAPRRSITADWMSIVMEAARRFDEESRSADGGLPELEEMAPAEESEPVSLAETKKKMQAVLEKAFGKKARKIQEELERVEEDPEKLMEYCGKAEKYIFVFIDNRKAKEVAEELRSIIRADRFS
jgi:DNA-directed RNA polymerase subunit F